MATTIVGLMDTAEEAHRVVCELTEKGFERSSIGLMATDQNDADEASPSAELGIDSVTGSGVLKGAGTGAALGGIAGLLVSIAAIPIPGIGPIIAAGPIASALAGAGVGAVAGTGVGVLTNMGVSEEHAHYYTEGVRRGGTLVTVNAPNDEMADQAATIMRAHCTVNIDERVNQWKASGWASRVASNNPVFTSRTTGQDENPYSVTGQTRGQVLPVTEEELQVRERQAELDEAALSSQIPETPLEETLRLHEINANAQRLRNNVTNQAYSYDTAPDKMLRRNIHEVYGGPERRRNNNPSYTGIERRAA